MVSIPDNGTFLKIHLKRKKISQNRTKEFHLEMIQKIIKFIQLLLNGEACKLFPQSVFAFLLQSTASEEINFAFQFASES